MEFRKENQNFVLRLEKGEKVMETLNSFLSEKQIVGGKIQGIGGIKNAELGFFHASKKDYEWKTFKEDVELISFLGTVSQTGLHAHVVISDDKFNAFGGHLKEAIVSVTVELFLSEMKKIRRKDAPEFNLKFMEL
ncbi:MAG: PPC domain-containing DNA-binding protein [Candidatus Micrarchaeota archaeon]